jgi:hypothetical protein
MSIENRSLIEDFENDQNPIFVIYGTPSRFEDVISGFHHHFRRNSENLYLPLDMGIAKCGTQEDTIFEIIHQLADQCVTKIPDPEEAASLSKSLSSFRKANREKVDDPPDIRLGLFMGFAEFVFYPKLQLLFRTKQRNIIGFERFEEVVEWSSKIHNFILDSLLKKLKGIHLRFVLFVERDSQPSLFYGSNQEDTRENITFYKLTEIVGDREENGGYLNYL